MNEIFNIRRFAAYALKWHRENLRVNLICLGAMSLLTFLWLCDFNPFRVIQVYLSSENEVLEFITKYKLKYANIFAWGILLYTFVVAWYSFRDYVLKERRISTLLLPVSHLERFVLALANSVIGVTIVYTLLFYGLASITTSYKYIGLKDAKAIQVEEVRGRGGMEVEKWNRGQKIYTQMGNVWSSESIVPELSKIKEDIQKQGTTIHFRNSSVSLSLLWNAGIILTLYVVAVGLWGGITFRRLSLLITVLLHLLLILGVGVISGFMVVGDLIERAKDTGLNFYGGEFAVNLPSSWWFMVYYIFPVAYLWVVWKKLKTKQA